MRSPQPGVARTRAERRIAADPTSTALLVAGPGALDLWPGTRRVAPVADRVLVEVERPDAEAPAAATVRVLAPHRTPTAYVTGFEWSGPTLPSATGQLTLSYGPGPSTLAVIDIDSYGEDDGLQARAEQFLANLARLAESRSRAA